jgi:hypothetical protein
VQGQRPVQLNTWELFIKHLFFNWKRLTTLRRANLKRYMQATMHSHHMYRFCPIKTSQPSSSFESLAIKNRRPCLHIGLTEQQLIPLEKQQRDTYSLIFMLFFVSRIEAPLLLRQTPLKAPSTKPQMQSPPPGASIVRAYCWMFVGTWALGASKQFFW